MNLKYINSKQREYTRSIFAYYSWLRLVDLRGPVLRVFILCFLAFIFPVSIDVAYAAGIASDKEGVFTVPPTTLRILLKRFLSWRCNSDQGRQKKLISRKYFDV